MADDLEFRLTWADDVDLDLSVQEPGGGFVIDYSSGASPSGGELEEDLFTAGTEVINWPSGQTPEGTDYLITAQISGATPGPLIPITLEAYRNGEPYQSAETTLDPNGGLYSGLRVRYTLGPDGGVWLQAVGVIEMGGDGEGALELVPEPPTWCGSYGWNWSGNTSHPYTASGYGPGLFSPSGSAQQNLSSVSTIPPGFEPCDGFPQYSLTLGSVSGMMSACISAVTAEGAWEPGELTRVHTASAGGRVGNLKVRINCSYQIEDLGSDNWKVSGSVSVLLGWSTGVGGTPSAAIVDYTFSDNTSGGAPFGHTGGSVSAAGAADGGVYTYQFPGGANVAADNIYSVTNPTYTASAGGSVGTAIGDGIASMDVSY